MAQFSHLGILAVKTISNAQALTNGVTAFSNSVELSPWAGFVTVEVSANTSTTTISQQCSSDNINWYDPVDNSGNALGAIWTGLSTTKYVQYSPVLTKYFRLKYVPTGSGSITTKITVEE